MSKKPDQLFSKDANQLAYGDCPLCASPLQLKFVGKSSFLGCTSYPACDYSQALSQNTVSTIKVIENSECPKCSKKLAVKKGRFGMFIGCTEFPACDYISSNQDKPSKAGYTPVACPKCKKGRLQEKQNRFGKTFYACSEYPSCKNIVNQEPVAQSCPECGAKILLKSSKTGSTLICAEQNCTYSSI